MVKNQFKTIALYSSKGDNKVTNIAHQLIEIFTNMGIRILIAKSSKKIHSDIKKTHTEDYIIKNADLLISIGGDGTLLSAARIFGAKGLPLMGINVGNIGFLTDISPDDLTNSVKQVLNGKYIKDNRFFLQAQINGKKSRDDHLALNEIVIHSGTVAQLIEYELFVDQKFVYRQRADGIIVSTQTGSTAYSLSGNGPIVHPGVEAIILQQMYPHSLNSRPLLVNMEAEIDIVLSGAKKAILSLDSHNLFSLKKKDKVHIAISKPFVTLIHPLSHDFYSACRTKLGWSLGIQNNKDQ